MKLNGMFTSIDEAIRHCEEKSFEAGNRGKIDHHIQNKQLAEWLIELKARREKEDIKLM